jgi:hypothetical protein
MSRAMLTLRSTAEREQAIQWVRKATDGKPRRVQGAGAVSLIKIRASGRC